jgi:SWI/SNF-related matrix-associated actin-dependent regulator of chromatin subfamily D
MVRDFAPPYKRITGTLADALKLPGGSPGQVRRALEKYATAHSTPDTTDPSIMHADRELEGLVGAKRITTAQLQSCVDAHLQPLDPVSLDYTVKLDGPSLSAIMCHDVQVGWPLKPAMLKLPPYLERLDIKGNLEAYDEKILGAL